MAVFCDLLKAVAYLYSHKEMGLEFHPSEGDPQLISFSDASWATDHVSSRSLTGGCIQFGGNTIFSVVKKQSIIARSSCESEWIACHVLCRQCEFVLEMLQFLNWNIENFTLFTFPGINLFFLEK